MLRVALGDDRRPCGVAAARLYAASNVYRVDDGARVPPEAEGGRLGEEGGGDGVEVAVAGHHLMEERGAGGGAVRSKDEREEAR